MNGFRPTLLTLLSGLFFLAILAVAALSWGEIGGMLVLGFAAVPALLIFLGHVVRDVGVTALARAREAPDALKAYRVSMNLMVVLGGLMYGYVLFGPKPDASRPFRDFDWLLGLWPMAALAVVMIGIGVLFRPGSPVRLALIAGSLALGGVLAVAGGNVVYQTYMAEGAG
jgi:hypothetical protein